MATGTIRQTRFFEGVKPARIYAAMLDGKEHTKMTGGSATCDARVGGSFTAWDGYIEGEILELRPHSLIVQSWRTSEWPKDAPPSRLRWTFKAEGSGTRVTMSHTQVPLTQTESYRGGWVDFYWTPMLRYFSGS